MKQVDKNYIWKNVLVYSLFIILLYIIWFIFIFFLTQSGANVGQSNPSWYSFSFIIMLSLYAIFVPLIWLIAKYSYQFYRYELEKDCLKIEKGILWKKYKMIPYKKIQNIDISRGPLDRLFKLSNLHIQTAGYSSPYPQTYEGGLLGLSVQTAKDLQAELMKKISI